MYSHYYTLNSIKEELVSGPRARTQSEQGETGDLLTTLGSGPRKTGRRQPKKQESLHPSDSESSLIDSMVSSDSEIVPSSLSDEDDSESEERVRETSSGASDDVSISGDDATEAASFSSSVPTSENAQLLFRHHLQGLYSVLKHLTNDAQHVTNKYQEEIGELSSSSSNISQLTSFVL